MSEAYREPRRNRPVRPRTQHRRSFSWGGGDECKERKAPPTTRLIHVLRELELAQCCDGTPESHSPDQPTHLHVDRVQRVNLSLQGIPLLLVLLPLGLRLIDLFLEANKNNMQEIARETHKALPVGLHALAVTWARHDAKHTPSTTIHPSIFLNTITPPAPPAYAIAANTFFHSTRPPTTAIARTTQPPPMTTLSNIEYATLDSTQVFVSLRLVAEYEVVHRAELGLHA